MPRCSTVSSWAALLDDASAYGCDLLFQELALAICTQEGIDLRFNHLDTTSFVLTGEYVPDSDEHAIRITHGYSKDHRPGPEAGGAGTDGVSKTGAFPREQELGSQHLRHPGFSTAGGGVDAKDTPTPRYFVADAKLYRRGQCRPIR